MISVDYNFDFSTIDGSGRFDAAINVNEQLDRLANLADLCHASGRFMRGPCSVTALLTCKNPSTRVYLNYR